MRIKNYLGVEELEIHPKNINMIEGRKGVGKTTVLDAIKASFNNKTDRPDIIKQGESESEIFIELDDGLTIDRKKRTDKADFNQLKDNGRIVNSMQSK